MKMAKKLKIIPRIVRLSKCGFTVKYLAGIYSHKGPRGLSEIEREVRKHSDCLGRKRK